MNLIVKLFFQRIYLINKWSYFVEISDWIPDVIDLPKIKPSPVLIFSAKIQIVQIDYYFICCFHVRAWLEERALVNGLATRVPLWKQSKDNKNQSITKG